MADVSKTDAETDTTTNAIPDDCYTPCARPGCNSLTLPVAHGSPYCDTRCKFTDEGAKAERAAVVAFLRCSSDPDGRPYCMDGGRSEMCGFCMQAIFIEKGEHHA